MTEEAAGKAAAGEPAGSIVRFAIETRVSKFTVQAFAGGMLSAIGHDPTFAARDYQGTIECNPDTAEAASLNLTVKSASLQLVDDMSQKDRKTLEETMRNEVLEVEKFPEITYVSTSSEITVKPNPDGPFEVKLNGNLTLHGVTRRQPISAKVVADRNMLKAFGDFTIRQSDYNIKQVSVAGGSLKVKDELKCVFDLVARPAAG